MSVTLNITIEDLKREIATDQYAKVSRLYDEAVGSIDQRTEDYKRFFGEILRQHGCETILDTSCGTGVDSALLLEQGFKVVSVDASNEMLERARKLRSEKSDDPRYQNWIIKQANWTTLPEDIASFLPEVQFDAVICLCNSFPHVFDADGDRHVQKKCLNNFLKCLKPGGIFLVDHRNYDAMINGSPVPVNGNAYYKYRHPMDVRSVVLVVDKPEMILLHYKTKLSEKIENASHNDDSNSDGWSEFDLRYYPLQLSIMSKMLEETFQHRTQYNIYADFKPLGEVAAPGFYIHVIKTKP